MAGRKTRNEAVAKAMGQRLKELFDNENLADVAKRIDGVVSRKALWSYINGLSIPSADVLMVISEKYNVSIDWLLKGQESLIPRDNKETDLLITFRRARAAGVAEQIMPYMHYLTETKAKGDAKKSLDVWDQIVEVNGLDTLGKRLRYIRVNELRLDQETFADRLNINADELADIEEDKALPRAMTLTTYNSKYNNVCPLDILLSGKS